MASNIGEYNKKYGSSAPQEKANFTKKAVEPDTVSSYNKKYGSATTAVGVQDSKGNIIGVTQKDSDIAKAITNKQTIYKVDGKLTLDVPKASIDFDEKTGKITVNTVKRIAEDPEFQSRFEILDTLSRNYQTNPKVTYPALDASGNETGDTWTTAEYIENLNTPNGDTGISPIQSIVNQFAEANRIKDAVASEYTQMNEDGTITPVELSYTDAMRLTAFDADKSNNDSTRIALPMGWKQLADAYKAESWDEETGTITLKDFYDLWYNREVRDESELLRTFSDLERYLTKSKVTQVGSVNTAEWTGAYALYHFMATHDPRCGFWQGAGDIVGGLASAAADFVLDTSTLLGTAGAAVIEGLYNIGAWVSEQNGTVAKGDLKSLGITKNMYQLLTDAHNTAKVMFGFNMDPEEAYRYKDNVLTLNSNAEFVESLGEFLLNSYMFIHAGNVMADKVAGMVSGAAKAATAVAEGTDLVAGARTLQALLGEKGTAAIFNMIAKTAESPIISFTLKTAGETFGEALFQDPQLLAQILAGDNLTTEGSQYLWETYANNFLYGAAAASAGRALYNVGQTTWGRAASTNLRNKVIYPLQKNVGDAFDALRVKLKGVESFEDILDGIDAKSPEKANVMRYRRTLREIRDRIGKESDVIEIIGKSKDEILEQLNKAEDNLKQLYDYEKALDNLLQSGRLKIGQWQNGDDFPTFKAVTKEIDNLTGNLLKAEKAASMQSAAKTFSGALFSQATTDYIGASVRVPILENAERVFTDLGDTKTVKKISEEVSYWQDYIKNYVKNTDGRVVNLADQYVDEYKKWWQSFNGVTIKEGLLSEAEIEDYKKRGEWGNQGELYARLQRQQEMSDYMVIRSDGKADRKIINELGHYNYGNTDSFVDPALVMQHELQLRSVEWSSAQIVRNGSVGASTVVDAATLKIQKEIQPLLKQFNQEARQGAKDLASMLDTKGLFQDAVSKTNLEALAKVNPEDAKSLTQAENSLASLANDVMKDARDSFFVKNSKAAITADKIAKTYFNDDLEQAKDFLFYEAMWTNRKSLHKQIAETARKEFDQAKVSGKKIAGDLTAKYGNATADMVENELEILRNRTRAEIAAKGGKASALIDHQKWQKEIYDTAKEITKIEEGDNIVAVRNTTGEVELVRADPLVAEFLTTKSAAKPMGAYDKVNYLWMRFFRAGTTALNPTSMANQMFRDLGNAWIMGNVTRTITGSTEVLTDLFGKEAADLMSSYSDETIEYFQKLAQEQGKTVEQVAAASEIGRGEILAKVSTETEALRLYKETRELWYKNGTAKVTNLDRTSKALEKLTDTLGASNEIREQYLRKLVYANNFADAIKGGRSIEQSRAFAEYIASNATINFIRGTTFLTNMQNSIPYLRSAINGTRSFWRLWSLDPVGVTGRLMGGLGMPVMYLTAMSLSSEENRKTYAKFKDYQKETALPVVINGKATSIPLPQELAPFLNPIRQMMEGAMGMNEGAGLEIVMSDILNLSPIDLGGFTDIDAYRIFGEGPSWGDRMSRGGAQLFSQIMPKYLTAAATAMTGRDLYTGNKIDTSYTTVDPDTGQISVISYSSGQLANAIHSLFPDAPAPVVQEVLENIFGAAGTQIIDFLTDLSQQVFTGNLDLVGVADRAVQTLITDVTKPFTPYLEHPAEAEWRRTIGELWDEKKQLLVSDEWQAYLTNKRNAQSVTQINAAAAARANIIDPFYNKVKDAVTALVQNNPEQFTANKYASVISLMNIQLGTADGNAYIDELNNDLYRQAKRAAIQTMVRMGFPSASDNAMLGRFVSTADGGAYIDYANPLELLNVQNTIYSQGNIYASEIKQVLKNNNLDNMDEVWTKIKSAKTTAEKDKIKADWDVQVGNAIAPLVRQYGADTMGSATAVTDYLDSILLVPSSYAKRNGKSVWAPNLDQQRGFGKQFIKDVFGGIK